MESDFWRLSGAGLLVHYLKVGQKLEGQPLHTTVHSDESSGGKLSQLAVLETRKILLPDSLAGVWGSAAFETRIKLLTGRTHQVRH